MEKSFGEILTESFTTFKKSFLPALGIQAVLLGVIIIFVIFAVIVAMLTAGIGSAKSMQNIQNISDFLTVGIPFLIEFVLFFCTIFFVSYLMQSWVILVIRNNVLVSKSFFKESFFETVRKFFKVVFFFLLVVGFLALVVAVIAFLSYLLGSKYILLLLLLLLPLGIILGPSLMMAFYGVLCREGKFWDIISEAFSLGFAKWGKIFCYNFLFSASCIFIMFLIAFGIGNFDGTMFGRLLGAIFPIFQFCMTLFMQCFYTIFYLDLAGIKPQQTENLTETNQINQSDQGQIMP
ncbi:MAG: hypothetical protein J5594_04170 [Elusimicrobiaceae bacterium]|nr:hypothetical protein [Elusimicrobiaceae bacterium]